MPGIRGYSLENGNMMPLPHSSFYGIVRNLAFIAVTILLGGILWQVVAVCVSALRGVDFPTPITTLRHLVRLLTGEEFIEHSLYRHIGDSLQRWFSGFSLAAFCGLAFGLSAGREGAFRRITLPLVHCLQLVPGLAWIPVALLPPDPRQKCPNQPRQDRCIPARTRKNQDHA